MSILNVIVNPPVQAVEGGEEDQFPMTCCPLHGDVLHLVLSHVPLLDLLSASHVSTSWRRAVASSLLHLSPSKPWLLLLPTTTNSRCSPSSTLAYDPRSRLWLDLPGPGPGPGPGPASSAVRSSHPSILYSLTPSSFSFSLDTFNLSWRLVPPPKVWRVDPVVALVGGRVVVAGGGCDFEDDPLSIESLDVAAGTGEWAPCGSMPALLKGSSSSLWLSVATDDDRMYVAERASGRTYAYSPEDREWSGPHDLRPAPDVFQIALGCVDDDGMMTVVGLIGEEEDVRAVKMWEVEVVVDTWAAREIGEMNKEMVEGLKDRSGCIWSIGVCGRGGTGYVYNPSGGSEGLVRWDKAGRDVVRWEIVRNAAAAVTERVVWRCVDVGIEQLERASSRGRKFRAKQGW